MLRVWSTTLLGYIELLFLVVWFADVLIRRQRGRAASTTTLPRAPGDRAKPERSGNGASTTLTYTSEASGKCAAEESNLTNSPPTGSHHDATVSYVHGVVSHQLLCHARQQVCPKRPPPPRSTPRIDLGIKHAAAWEERCNGGQSYMSSSSSTGARGCLRGAGAGHASWPHLFLA